MSYAAIYRMLEANQIKEAKAFSRRQVERELFSAWRDGQIKLPEEQLDIDAKNTLEFERQAVLLEAKAEIEAQEKQGRLVQTANTSAKSLQHLSAGLQAEKPEAELPPDDVLKQMSERGAKAAAAGDDLRKKVVAGLKAPAQKAITPDSCRKVFPTSEPDGKSTEAVVSPAPVGERKPYKGESMRVNPVRIQELLKQRGCQNRSQMAYYLGFPAVSSIPNILGIIEPGRTTKTLYGQYLIDILGPEISAE